MAGAPGGGIVGRSVNFLIQFITTGHAQAVQQITTFSQVSQQAQQQMGRMGHQTRTLTFEVVRWAIAWQVVYRTLNLVGAGFRDAIAAGIELDTAMRNVNAIAKLSEGQLALLRKEVIGLSTDTSAGLRPLKELSEALYSINSAGIIGAQAMDVLRSAAAAAAAGLTDTETAATAIVSVLNAYNLSAREAGRVTDVLFKMVEVGVPRFEDFAKNVGVAAGTGRMLGVSVEELGQSLATVSRVETNAARAQVALNQVMLAFLKPSDAMIEAYDRLGVATGRDLVAKRGLIQAVLDVNEAMGGSIELVFDERRALTGANAIITAHAAALQQWGERGKEAGTASKALAEIQKSALTPLQQYRREWERLRLEWTEGVLPTLAKLIGGLASIMQMVRESGDPTDIAGRALTRRGLGGPAGPLLSLIAPGVFERWMAEERLRQLGRFPGQVGGAIAGIGLRTGELPLPQAPPTRRPVGPAPLSFDQLMRMFEMRQARGEFTTAGEIRGVGGILIPQAEKELAVAQRRLKLVGDFLKFQQEQLQILRQVNAETNVIQASEEATAKASDEFKEALEKVKSLEDQLVSLESKRLSLAKELASQALALGSAYQDALDALRDVQIEEADIRLENVQRGLQMLLDPLERFRDAMGDALDPKRAEALRKELQRLSLAQITAEMANLRLLMETEQDPRRRAGFARQLAGAVQRRAGIQAGFYVEDVQTEQREFDAQQKARDERRARLQRMLQEDPFGARGAFAREQLTPTGQLRAFQLQRRPEISEEKVKSFYEKATEEANKLFSDVILPNIQKAEDAAREVAKGALKALAEFGEDFAKIDWKAMGERAGNLWREGFYKNGMLPPGFQRERDDARRGELGVLKRPGGGSSTELSVTIQDPRLGGGAPTNIPLLVKGQVGIENLLRGSQPTREQVGIAIERAIERVAQGAILIFFKTLQDAIRAAQTRPVEEKVPISGPGSAALRGAIIIQIGTANLTGLSDRTKQELVAAVMGIAGDQAVQMERRHGTATQVA